MGKNKELTAEQRGAIIFCHQRGDSYRTISETVDCGVSTVRDTIIRFRTTGLTESIHHSGRPSLIPISQRNRLKQIVTNDKTKNRRLCAAGIQQLWKKKSGQDVSTKTIRRALHSTGLKNCVARRKPLISPANMEARLAWCLEHQNWTKADWSKVMWSDESTFSDR